MKKVIILGITGMLGSMVDFYFRRKTAFKVISTHRGSQKIDSNLFHFDAENQISTLEDIIKKNVKVDYIINCIGIIKPYCKDNDEEGKLRAIKVNALFPHVLEKVGNERGIKIIQIATDCVYSGKTGNYVEGSPHDPLDVYGKSKSLGEIYCRNFINLRCSIIGSERKSKLSLLEWVLNRPDGSAVNGFTNHKWNGLTTLQFAKLCEEIIQKQRFEEMLKESHTWHCIVNETVTKYQLVSHIASEFKKSLKIVPSESSEGPIDRTLASERKNREFAHGDYSMKAAIKDLYDFIQNEGYYDVQ